MVAGFALPATRVTAFELEAQIRVNMVRNIRGRSQHMKLEKVSTFEETLIVRITKETSKLF